MSNSQIPLSIPLQGHPSHPRTFFLFPDGSGAAVSYAWIPQIAPDLCVYGLNSPYLKTDQKAYFNVSDLVKAWISEVRVCQPKGPYILGGWSAGGYYAFEVAKILLSEGDEIESLVIIDTPPRNRYEAMPPETFRWLARHKVMGNTQENPPAWLVEHFQASLGAIDRYHPSPLDSTALLKRAYIVWASDAVLDNSKYNIEGLDLNVKVSSFLLRQRTDFGSNGWDELLPGCELHTTRAPGSHFTMVMTPNVSLALVLHAVRLFY